MSKQKDLTAKLQSMAEHSNDSRESETGYMDVGNDMAPKAKARAVRNNENGSHH